MKKILFISLASLSLAACTKNVDRSANCGKSTEITFQTANYLTKTVSASAYDKDHFATYAFCDAVVEGQYFMDNVKITKQGSVWKPEVGKFYWPKTSTVDFISYYPYDATKACPVIAKNTITYTAYTVGTDDLCFASKAVGYTANVDEINDNLPEGSVDGGYNGVPTLFHHALAKINVNVNAAFLTDGDEYQWEIAVNSAKFSGVATKGDLSLSLSDGAATGIVDWILPDNKIWSNPQSVSDLVFTPSSTAMSETSSSLASDIYVLPQALDAQKAEFVFSIITKKKNASGSFVKFMEETETISVALKTSTLAAWEMGKNIIYNFVVTPVKCSTDDPDPSPLEITFDPAVVDWVDVDAEDILLK